jgi:hypothetical protein
MFFISCSLDNALKCLIGLGKSVAQVLVTDNNVFYILLTDMITPEALRFIHARGLQMVVLSFQQYDHLMGNTPMNLRKAIQSGLIRRESDTPDNIWNMLCRRAGIINEPWSKTANLFAQHIAGCVLSAGIKLTSAQTIHPSRQ